MELEALEARKHMEKNEPLAWAVSPYTGCCMWVQVRLRQRLERVRRRAPRRAFEREGAATWDAQARSVHLPVLQRQQAGLPRRRLSQS